MVEHNQNETEVNQCEHKNYSPESLGWMEEVKSIWFQVREAAKEKDHSIDSSPPISNYDNICCLIISW